MRKPIERRECATGLVWAQHAYVKLRICIDAYVRFVVNALWCVFSTLSQWKVAFMNYCWYKKIFNNFLVPGKSFSHLTIMFSGSILDCSFIDGIFPTDFPIEFWIFIIFTEAVSEFTFRPKEWDQGDDSNDRLFQWVDGRCRSKKRNQTK